ncbi:MAG: DsbA family protein [Bacillaceae bacterium]|nr:DsbA family protein [Bacillaceae bacterium]
MGKQRNTHDKSRQNLVMVTGVIFVVLLIGLGIYNLLSGMIGGDEAGEINLDGQPMLGDPDAPVTIVEFADFKCPACKSFYDHIMSELKSDYIDTGKAKLYFMNFPVVSRDSYTAAMAGEAIYRQDQEAFWAFYETVYKNQPDEGLEWATPEFLVELAKQSGAELDLETLQKDLAYNRYQSDVLKDKEAGQKAGINATPSLLINGQNVQNPFDYEEIKRLIEQELGGGSDEK